jgi:hypothetical protein
VTFGDPAEVEGRAMTQPWPLVSPMVGLVGIVVQKSKNESTAALAAI